MHCAFPALGKNGWLQNAIFQTAQYRYMSRLKGLTLLIPFPYTLTVLHAFSGTIRCLTAFSFLYTINIAVGFTTYSKYYFILWGLTLTLLRSLLAALQTIATYLHDCREVFHHTVTSVIATLETTSSTVVFPASDLIQRLALSDSNVSASWLAILDTYQDIPPHPDQGGERISEGFLQSMQEAECIW
ncbi:hypothetical protein K439DRAFT_1610922 [Ramaria rubella]|nr:hypothetical protein K439DRAFT_1610922 [Ramaria rubella]